MALDPRTLPYRACVGVMLLNGAGQAFVGQRRDFKLSSDVAAPAWQMPQGGVDPGEEPEAAALRELWEETGIGADLVRVEARTKTPVRYDLPPELLGKIWNGKYRGQEQVWFRMRFLGRDSDVNIDTQHPEFSQWKWLATDQLVTHIVPFKRAVYQAVVAELAP